MNNSFPTHKLCADINKCEHPSRHAINNLSSSLPLSLFLSVSFCLPLLAVNKMSPRPSLAPTEDGSYGGAYQQQTQDAYAANQNNNNNNNMTGGSTAGNSSKNEPGRRAGACRVCLKSFKPDDYHKTCFECQQRVCEDCASYSKLEENEDAVSTSIKDA